VGCDGDRRVKVGDPSAARDLKRYEARVKDISPLLPAAVQQAEARRLADEFIQEHHGTAEVAQIWFWPEFQAESSGLLRSLWQARQRIVAVVQALDREP
jgi:hypothetical protein